MRTHNVEEILAMGGATKYAKKMGLKQDLSKLVGTVKLTPKQNKELDELLYGKNNK